MRAYDELAGVRSRTRDVAAAHRLAFRLLYRRERETADEVHDRN
jgi:hypothetical protein